MPTLPTLYITGKTGLGPKEKEFVCGTQKFALIFYSEHFHHSSWIVRACLRFFKSYHFNFPEIKLITGEIWNGSHENGSCQVERRKI